MTMTSNERLDGLLAYLDGLTKLKYEGDYMCVKEMTECIGWIREEFTKEDEKPSANSFYMGSKTAGIRVTEPSSNLYLRPRDGGDVRVTLNDISSVVVDRVADELARREQVRSDPYGE